MTCSPAQLEANRRNSARSTGPRTAEGKERSRANSLKHGMTGDGIVIPPSDSAEVARRVAEFEKSMKPHDEVTRFLVRRVAVLTTRLDRCMTHEMVRLDELAEDGVDVYFDNSEESHLARRYEFASERSLYRTLNELKARQAHSNAAIDQEIKASGRQSGSFLQDIPHAPEPRAEAPRPSPAPAMGPISPATQSTYLPMITGVDVPFAIGLAPGKRR